MTRPTLTDLRDELRRGGAAEGDVRCEGWHLDGACLESGVVIVNPMPSYVISACHELLHRMHPKWGHKRIDRELRHLLYEASSDDVAAFYRAYRRKARKLSRPVTVQPTTKD
jgi:hypothetical protein